MYCGQRQLGERVDIARRDSERENDVLPDHYGGLLAEGAMFTSLKWLFSWSWASWPPGKKAGAGILSISELIPRRIPPGVYH